MTEEAAEEHRMPLMEHLIELRKRLMISFIAFFLIFLACYYFSKPIYGFLVEPLAVVMEKHGDSNRRLENGMREPECIVQNSDLFAHRNSLKPLPFRARTSAWSRNRGNRAELDFSSDKRS